MKMLTLVTLLVAASVVTAQTETAAPAMPMAPVATEIKAEMKKAKRVKKPVKPKAKLTAPVSPVVEVAPVVVPAVTAAAPVVAPATTTVVAPAAKTQSAAATETSTTITTVADANAPKKNWSVGLTSELSADAASVGNIGKDGVSTISSVSLGYRINPDLKLTVSQYFNYDANPQAKDKSVQQGFTVLKAATAKIKGILGSDDIAPLFWLYLPTKTAIKNAYKADVDMNTIIRMDAEVVWTLNNSKFQIGYYVNPRQSFIPTQRIALDSADLTKLTTFESTTTLIHWLSLYYNVNDNIQPYIYGGMDNRMATERFTSTKDHVLAGLGSNFSLLGGKLVLIPEVSADIDLKTNGVYAKAPKWFSPEDLGYALTASMSY